MHRVKRGKYSSDQSQSSKWGLDYFSNYGPAEVATRWYSQLQMTWRSDLGNTAEWTRVPCLSLFPWDRPRPLRIPNQCLTDKQLKEKLKDLVHDSIRLYENCSIILFQATCESLCIYGLICNKVLTVMSARRALHSLAFRGNGLRSVFCAFPLFTRIQFSAWFSCLETWSRRCHFTPVRHNSELNWGTIQLNG